MDLDAEIALNAALLSANLKIPMVDSVILAAAQKYNAVLWTQDIHKNNTVSGKLSVFRPERETSEAIYCL